MEPNVTMRHIFSLGRMSQPEKQRQFSHKTFLTDEKNTVCSVLAHKKCGKCQPRKVMREKAPFVPLNICNAAKSIIRKREKYSEKRHSQT